MRCISSEQYPEGDVSVSYADSTALKRDYGFRSEINIRQSLRAFANGIKLSICHDASELGGIAGHWFTSL